MLRISRDWRQCVRREPNVIHLATMHGAHKDAAERKYGIFTQLLGIRTKFKKIKACQRSRPPELAPPSFKKKSCAKTDVDPQRLSTPFKKYE